MQRIYKYELAITDIQQISMPVRARVLSVANQGGKLCLWAMVTPNTPYNLRSFRIIGTGNPIEDNPFDKNPTGAFIGTVLMPPFVWHVFEL